MENRLIALTRKLLSEPPLGAISSSRLRFYNIERCPNSDGNWAKQTTGALKKKAADVKDAYCHKKEIGRLDPLRGVGGDVTVENISVT